MQTRSRYTQAGVVFALILIAVAAGAQTCGTERWNVKTLQDNPKLKPAKDAEVRYLRSLDAPERPNKRVIEETQIYRVPVLILALKREADFDLHVVVADPTDPSATMVAEVPLAKCANPQYSDKFNAVRQKLLTTTRSKLPKGKLIRLYRPRAATITGVLFFDKIHGQSGVAPNGVEIHPILEISLEE